MGFLRVLPLFFMMLCRIAGAAEFDLSPEMNGESIGRYVETCVAQHFGETADDVMHAPCTFQPNDASWIRLGMVKGTTWLRFKVKNPSLTESTWRLSLDIPMTESLELYQVEAGRLSAPLLPRFKPFPTFTIKSGRGINEYWVRVDMRARQNYAIRAWSLDASNHSSIVNTFWSSLILGGLLSMLTFHIFISIALRKDRAFWYALLILCVSFKVFHGFGWLNYLPQELRLGGAKLVSPLIASSLFALLKICWDRYPLIWGGKRLRRALQCEALGLGAMLLFIVGFDCAWLVWPAVFYCLLVVLPTISIVSILVFWRVWFYQHPGHRSEIWHILAILMLLPGAFAHLLAHTNLIYPASVFQMYYLGAWAVLASILISLSYGIRIRKIARDREVAQVALMAERQKHIVQLERQVQQRTTAYKAEKERAEQLFNMQKTMLTIVSHDMRSPLSSLKLALARLSTEVAEQHKKTFMLLLQTVDLLIDRTEALLRHSGFENRDLPIKPERLKLFDVVGEVMTSLSEIADRKSIRLVNLIPEEIFMEADRLLMGEAIGNLIANALKFCDAEAEIRVYSDGSSAFCIHDDGPGIPQEIMSRLFTSDCPTYAGTQGETGSGLGLFASRKIIEAHGGSLEYLPMVATGACFRIGMPSDIAF